MSTSPPRPSTPPPVTSTPALSLLPTRGSDGSPVSESPVGAIAGALVGVMVVVVAAIAVVLLVVLVLRRRQRKRPHPPDTQDRTVDNPIYAGSVLYRQSDKNPITHRLIDLLVYLTNSKNRNVVLSKQLFQLNVGHKDTTVS